MISEDRTRKLSIDAAVAKELKRRGFVVWCLWGLIALAVTLTGWILYKGYNVKSLVGLLIIENPEPVAKELASKPDFLDKTSDKLASTPDFLDKTSDELASKPDFLDKTSDILASKPDFLDKTSSKLASTPDFLDKTSDILASKTDIQKRITSLLSKDQEFQKSITGSTAFTESVAYELERNDDFVSRIAKAVPKGTHISKLQKRLSSLEQELSDLRQQLKNVKTELAGDIEALKSEYALLPRNYLLKTNQLNDLTALGMKVKIGRKTEDAISEFSVQKEGSVSCKKRAVQLGQPFFCNIGNYRYRIELTFHVDRWFVEDYVGMEIVKGPID